MCHNQLRKEVIMKIKKKSILFRMVSVLMAVLALSIITSFTAVTAAAAEEVAEIVTAEVVEAVPEAEHLHAAMLRTEAHFAPPVHFLAGGAGGGGGTALDTQSDGDEQFKSVVNFFVKWIKRVGLLVAFVGGVMFALAIKNNDAEQKQSGLLTLVAGFVVSALCQAVDMFDIFT